jgi:hypothetical protein
MPYPQTANHCPIKLLIKSNFPRLTILTSIPWVSKVIVTASALIPYQNKQITAVCDLKQLQIADKFHTY